MQAAEKDDMSDEIRCSLGSDKPEASPTHLFVEVEPLVDFANDNGDSPENHQVGHEEGVHQECKSCLPCLDIR